MSDYAKIRRDRTIKLSIASIAITFISLSLSKISVDFNHVILLIVKLYFIYYTISACYCVFKDDSEIVTSEMDEAIKVTKDSLKRGSEEKVFSNRDSRAEQNYKTKKFVENKE